MIGDVQLPIVDGFDLPGPIRSLLRPGELVRAPNGEDHRLPRFFYVVESTSVALNTQLTQDFALWEFIEVDLHESPLLRAFPRYVPCAVTSLANALQVLRSTVGVPVRIAANGGYRSPSHAASKAGSPHVWGTAANVYRIGADYLDNDERIQRYAEIAMRALAGCWLRPFGTATGQADDHLHLDLGYVTAVPPGMSEAGK
jgi:hypothetical protein